MKHEFLRSFGRESAIEIASISRQGYDRETLGVARVLEVEDTTVPGADH